MRPVAQMAQSGHDTIAVAAHGTSKGIARDLAPGSTMQLVSPVFQGSSMGIVDSRFP
jgi:hypothetical protein